ncbi:potassium channel family protein [Candidatus Viadribacter manganicus]|uniref:potassium channel family protein n=1 Tax=Candidatus Viadribacter manganicus TaxID=1759059 RepID=UPI001D176D66|nr:ion channel [Candidatus Viadribacter manganicus]
MRSLYFGHTQSAERFQGLLLALDLLIIGFFVVSQFIQDLPWFWIVDAAIAAFLAIDLFARLFALGSFKRWLKYPITWVDIIVLATFVFPAFLANWGFLRILRLWGVVQSERFWNVLARGRFDDTHVEDLTKSVVTLVTFIFLSAGLTQALFIGEHPKLNNFVDAIYFVVTSLTTTGYGDITIDSAFGRLFSVGLMLTGISLFFSIAQKVFAAPQKIVACSSCGLDRHDPDAQFCKLCGDRLTSPLRGRARKARGGRQSPSLAKGG